MIIVMTREATDGDIQIIVEKVEELGLKAHVIRGIMNTVIGAIGENKDKERVNSFVNYPGVESVMPIAKPYKLASRTFKKEDTVFSVNGVQFGGGNFVVIAGPCSVESEQQTLEAARAVKASGAQFLRGGAFKPRTSPYSFQGLKDEGLRILQKAKQETGLGIVTELVTPQDAPLVAEYTDIIQVGARNMQNFGLLLAAGKTKKPVLLKRGMSATIEEFLMSAEYIMSEGSYDVIMCERGIRTFETAYRNTLDLNAVPALKLLTHLPVFVDPSHGTGRRDLILPMSKAAIAAGADGLILEVHPHPEQAMSDGPQSLTPKEFDTLMKEIRPFVEAAGKKLHAIK